MGTRQQVPNKQHIEAAGLALQELQKHGDVLDAQISMAMMISAIAQMHQWDAEQMVQTMHYNMVKIVNDTALFAEVMIGIDNILHGENFELPDLPISNADVQH